ncbi:class I SAM-dependent methyltransferase [Actinomycetospora chiangmaiensis]|uniref:class I SAM-dependent methyltransferase n=1 Tax=Actinomycetospora chiangmaiensis TaxID=402650 RepID=UPI0012F70EB2|nr:class I SAM-dependent methyltransferase [Actinomycetospora chiangmaiensis]
MRSPSRYGIDGWPYLLGLSGLTVGLATVAAGSIRTRPTLAVSAALAAGVTAVPAVWGGHYVLRGKHTLRDRLLDEVPWSGDEVVVDLGAGAGLLAVGAAHRTHGPVHAVDLFVPTDLSGNSADRLRDNAERENVAHRVRVHRCDIREVDLPDAGVDVVLSTLCLHNLAHVSERRAALDEAVRLVRPEGTLVISDLAHVEDEYAPHLRAAGFDVRVERATATFPPQHYIVARAPAAGSSERSRPGSRT